MKQVSRKELEKRDDNSLSKKAITKKTHFDDKVANLVKVFFLIDSS